MRVGSVLRQSLPLLILCGIGEVFAGSVLGGMKNILDENPGFLVLIPAIIALRGNISMALGSRLGSAAHLGIIDMKNLFNKETKENLKASIFLSIFISGIAGIFAYLTCMFFNINANFFFLFGTAILAGTIAGLILTFITIFVIIIAFKKEYDPDNVTGPALATVADLITILTLFGSAVIIGGIL